MTAHVPCLSHSSRLLAMNTMMPPDFLVVAIFVY
jgi:hypothetical protein